MSTKTVDYESRLLGWYKFRQHLETCPNPLEEVSNYFEKLPRVKFYTDPYDSKTWPTPWELISENEYCHFNVLLGISYTLQLTERFKNCQPKITIELDVKSRSVYYLLYVCNKVYGYNNEWIDPEVLPNSLSAQKIYKKECWIN